MQAESKYPAISRQGGGTGLACVLMKEVGYSVVTFFGSFVPARQCNLDRQETCFGGKWTIGGIQPRIIRPVMLRLLRL